MENQGEFVVPIEQTKQSLHSSYQEMFGLFQDLVQPSQVENRWEIFQQISDKQIKCRDESIKLITLGERDESVWRLHPVIQRLPTIFETTFSKYPQPDTPELQRQLIDEIMKETVHVTLDHSAHVKLPTIHNLNRIMGVDHSLAGLKEYCDCPFVVDSFPWHVPRSYFENGWLAAIDQQFASKSPMLAESLKNQSTKRFNYNRLSRNQFAKVANFVAYNDDLLSPALQELYGSPKSAIWKSLDTVVYSHMSLEEKRQFVHQTDLVVGQIAAELLYKDTAAKEQLNH